MLVEKRGPVISTYPNPNAPSSFARRRLELDAKSWSKDSNRLRREFDDLRSDFVQVKDKARLAADFVDWYARKGEAFEGNLNAVDRHIKELVVDNSRVVD